MVKYLRLTRCLTQESDKVEFMQIPRGQNMEADEIAKMASSEDGSTSTKLDMEVQKWSYIKEVSTFAIQSTNS